ncbi:prepilin-type N-terminal cleavage/methylation domain-containing protein [Singulisphaera sp. GP187]|uniref:type II secretion system protein n=1 Tax=Singulisphaera sp. GP187 TaxID=1882752 RepID=UPI0009287E73|nr:type II secretion system protein [Singulisphaera sp. GP187]SIO11695.1 prepilin-type N-terminal cleavage/methylation domain-containing protein [Singulisphaera sp. GP187]
MRNRFPRPCSPRRGVTLIEMLVAVMLLVLMMTVIVTIFTSATGAVSGLQVFHQLDGDLRQLDITIRTDLNGLTAKVTPPINPNDNLGYLEIGENAFADLQNEDTDDYIRFTAKAPDGQPFKGRIWLGATNTTANQPVLMTSQYAEIIYFLRNGNLYRRVFLVAPEKQDAVNTAWKNATSGGTLPLAFYPSIFGGTLSTSWLGVNDLSARPSATGVPGSMSTLYPIQLNTLGDLTNRQNRAFYQRYGNDFTNNLGVAGGDGIADDNNPDAVPNIVGDGVTDYPPTLYYGMPASSLLFEATTAARVASTETLAFPYLFPGAYSVPDSSAYSGSLTGSGWIHSTDPSPNPAFANALDQLSRINHSPLASGDSLNPPASTSTQTWWGFPTWRETMLPRWTDPSVQVSSGSQPDGLHPFVATANPAAGANATNMGLNFLPPMTSAYRVTPQDYTDGLGTALTGTSSSLWLSCWDDDLIMTGVRSFDIKVFDNSFPGYVDLGWGDDLRLQPITSPTGAAKTFLSQANGAQFTTQTLPVTYWNTGAFDTLTQTFAHEGRMPPLYNDLRIDAQFPNPFYPAITYPLVSSTYNGNVGDANAAVMRLRRVWDSWSTDYTRVPATGFDPTTKLPVGPPWSPPIYPSYPAPYPAPMRGIQIQIRVVDPRNERVKTLTIRQDFSEKL